MGKKYLLEGKYAVPNLILELGSSSSGLRLFSQRLKQRYSSMVPVWKSQ